MDASTADLLATAEKLFRIAAYVVAAAWVITNFYLSRTYRTRVDPTADAEIVQQKGKALIIARCSAKNVGQGKLRLHAPLNVVRIYDLATTGGALQWRLITATPVFATTDVLEPGETVTDAILVPAVSVPLAVKVEAIVGSKKHNWRVTIIKGEHSR